MSVAAGPARGSRRALAAAAVALAVVLIEASAVPVLLPSVRLDLGSSSSGVQWAQNAYLLALAALLPWIARAPAGAARGLAPAGAASPARSPFARPGATRVTAAAGALAMAAGAVVCASAESTAVLVAGRAAQGAGAAAVLAALAGAMLPAPRRDALAPPAGRPGGFALAAALPVLAVALAPLVGGLFAEADWWRVFFWASVPLAAAAAAPAVVPETVRPAPVTGWPGGHLAAPLGLAAGLIALTAMLVQSEPWGLGWPGLVVLLALAAAAPLWPGRLPPAAVSWFALGGCLATLTFLMPQYFELARGLSPLRGGVLLLALTLPAAAAWLAARWLGARRLLAPAGLAAAALGLAALAPLGADSGYALPLLALALTGAGLGALAGTAPAGAPTTTLVAAALVGAALWLAAAGAVSQHVQAEVRAGGDSFEQALARGVGWAALALLVLLLVAALGRGALRRSASRARRAEAS